MSYVQENATLQEAVEALKAGAQASHNECGTVRLRSDGYFFDEENDHMIFSEQKLTGWRIEWPDAPACEDCKNNVCGGCQLALRETDYADPRKLNDQCGPQGKWFEPREENAECVDVPVHVAPGDGFFSIDHDVDPHMDITSMAAHKDFMGYIYEGEDEPRSEVILWRHVMKDGRKGKLCRRHQNDGSYVAERPVAVRMKKEKK